MSDDETNAPCEHSKRLADWDAHVAEDDPRRPKPPEVRLVDVVADLLGAAQQSFSDSVRNREAGDYELATFDQAHAAHWYALARAALDAHQTLERVRGVVEWLDARTWELGEQAWTPEGSEAFNEGCLVLDKLREALGEDGGDDDEG